MNPCQNIILNHTDYINEIENLALDQTQGLITQEEYDKKLNKLNARAKW